MTVVKVFKDLSINLIEKDRLQFKGFIGTLNCDDIYQYIHYPENYLSLKVISFASRENKGLQPVGDNVRVDVLLNGRWECNNEAEVWYWGLNSDDSITEWKPSLIQTTVKPLAQHVSNELQLQRKIVQLNKCITQVANYVGVSTCGGVDIQDKEKPELCASAADIIRKIIQDKNAIRREDEIRNLMLSWGHDLDEVTPDDIVYIVIKQMLEEGYKKS